jgi:hypothetical protein
MGNNVLPALGQALQATDEELRRQANNFLDKLHEKAMSQQSTVLVPLAEKDLQMHKNTSVIARG